MFVILLPRLSRAGISYQEKRENTNRCRLIFKGVFQAGIETPEKAIKNQLRKKAERNASPKAGRVSDKARKHQVFDYTTSLQHLAQKKRNSVHDVQKACNEEPSLFDLRRYS